MSGATQSPLTTVDALRASLVAVVSYAHQLLASTVRGAAFWTAAVLPLAYVPFAVDLGPSTSTQLFLGLVALHAVCLAVGHEHTPATRA